MARDYARRGYPISIFAGDRDSCLTGKAGEQLAYKYNFSWIFAASKDKQNNGLAESTNKAVAFVHRSFLDFGGAPVGCWPFQVLRGYDALNNMSRDGNPTANEILTGRSPTANLLREPPIWSYCFFVEEVHLNGAERDGVSRTKLHAALRQGYYIRYVSERHEHAVLDPKRAIIVHCKHVRVIELTVRRKNPILINFGGLKGASAVRPSGIDPFSFFPSEAEVTEGMIAIDELSHLTNMMSQLLERRATIEDISTGGASDVTSMFHAEYDARDKFVTYARDMDDLRRGITHLVEDVGLYVNSGSNALGTHIPPTVSDTVTREIKADNCWVTDTSWYEPKITATGYSIKKFTSTSTGGSKENEFELWDEDNRFPPKFDTMPFDRKIQICGLDIIHEAFDNPMHKLAPKQGRGKVNADGSPKSWRDMLKRDDSAEWIENAVEPELKSHEIEKQSYEYVHPDDVPADEKGSLYRFLWVFKHRSNGDMKGRLTVDGGRCDGNLHKSETSYRACRPGTIRHMALAAIQYILTVNHLDVKTAFLNAFLKKARYAHQPPGRKIMIRGIKALCKITRAIYGFKFSGKLWMDLVTSWLTRHNYPFLLFSETPSLGMLRRWGRRWQVSPIP